MLSIERHEQILQILMEKKSVTVGELSKTMFVSDATIRRDLSQMEKERLIKRSHGGAVLFESTNDETSILMREQENIKQKKIIAEIALKFIKNHDTLFVDSSSTAGIVIPLLKNFKYISVITNGIKNSLYLSQNTDAKIYIAGGVVNNRSNSIVGTDTLDYLGKMNADVSLVSCSGISLENGVTESSYEQSHIKRVMIRNSKVKLVLCDSSKFDSTYLCRSLGLEEIDYLITDQKPREEYLQKAEACGCKILYPEKL